MNIDALFDLLNSVHGFDWMEISDELLAEGYVWEYSAAKNCYHLIDLSNSSYFE